MSTKSFHPERESNHSMGTQRPDNSKRSEVRGLSLFMNRGLTLRTWAERTHAGAQVLIFDITQVLSHGPSTVPMRLGDISINVK
jgi:hypothetical protein